MKTSLRLPGKVSLSFLFFFIATALIFGGGSFLQPQMAEAKITKGTVLPPEDVTPLDKDNPRLRPAIDVRERHHNGLMALPDVIGTGVSLTENQQPAVAVFTRKQSAAGQIPGELEGTPLVELVTGDIVIMPSSKGTPAIKPTGWFPRPVPIGVSTGNQGECSAGTIGARVKDKSGNVYALSNNHVYALENDAPIGSDVLQPGRYDTQCVTNPANVIGTLYSFVPISFSSNNTVDAAIARSSVGYLDNKTPSNGYGVPDSSTTSASIGQAVQKYGRTTSLTTGTVQAINTTVRVGYSTGTATFVNQIVVTSRKAFIKAGDSGSLLVTNDSNSNANPVGLLFAGNSSGTYAVANPIAEVLHSFGITIDGK
jgi:hypothetical protein